VEECRLACVCAETHLAIVKFDVESIIALMVREVKSLSCLVNVISRSLIHHAKSRARPIPFHSIVANFVTLGTTVAWLFKLC
jgi:hypothetical protein